MVNEKMISNLHTRLRAAHQPLTALQALGDSVVRRQRVQGLHFGRGEERVMAAHRQWALPFSVDAQDPQLPIVTGHVGGARGVHTLTLRGGTALRAAISKGITIFCRRRKKIGQKAIVLIHCLQKRRKCVFVHVKLFKCMCM